MIGTDKGCEQWKTGDDRLSGYAQVIVTNCKERQKQVYDVLRLFVADRSVLNVNCYKNNSSFIRKINLKTHTKYKFTLVLSSICFNILKVVQ